MNISYSLIYLRKNCKFLLLKATKFSIFNRLLILINMILSELMKVQNIKNLFSYKELKTLKEKNAFMIDSLLLKKLKQYQLMDNKYFRVKQTDSSSFRHTLRIKQAVQQKKYLYLDLSDDRKVSLHTENHLKQLQNSQPDRQEEVTEYIGNHHIGGVHQLSFKTSQMLQYLSENKIVNQQRRQIDEIVRNRISKQKHFLEQNYQRKKSRSHFKSEKKQSKSMRFSLDSPELEKYLESKKTEQIYRSLAQKEMQLQHSVSGTGDSFISDRMKVLLAKQNTEISLPQIKSVHLKKMRKR